MKTNDKPQLQEFAIEGVKHINPSDAFEALKNGKAVLIDVREEDEVKREYIPLDNVLNHPMTVIMERLPFIAKDQHIILGCPGGVRSSKVANLLNLQGYPNVANLDGGFDTWKAKGFPMKSNSVASSGCGCGCNPVPEKNNGGCC
ncbi:MAG: rhodanese-like domain-containing protein [Bacteroidetes bacterium]|nr:MAG: rhodanese-like domain-containing protein [Bacteroidota bacterium]